MSARGHVLRISMLSIWLAACAAQDDGSDTQDERCEEALGGCQQPPVETLPAQQSDAPPTRDETIRATDESGFSAADPQARVFGVGTSCTPTSCRNGGTCVEQWLGYTCICPPGFSGAQCQTGGTSGGGSGCGPLTGPANGTVRTTSGTGVGSRATYVCSAGFTLSGAATRTCQSNRTWSGVAPICLGCGDGVVSAQLGEQCEVGPSSDPWSCIRCRRTNGSYAVCPASGVCPQGLGCHSGGYCTFPGCSNDAQCAPTPPGRVRAECVQGFACTLRGCTSSADCPPGLGCNREGYCAAP